MSEMMGNADVPSTVIETDLMHAETKVSGAMLVERAIQEILKKALPALKADTQILDDLFFKLDAAALADVKTFFSTNDVEVLLNFPRDNWKPPYVVIQNASDTEVQGMALLGDYMGPTLDSTLGAVGEVYGRAMQSQYDILCLTGKDSNAALYLYYVVQALLMLNILELHRHGIHNVTFSGQAIELRDDIMPEFSYARRLQLSCQHYLAIRITQRLIASVVVILRDNDGEQINLGTDT